MKTCIKCNVTKDFVEFASNGSDKEDGKRKSCKCCENKRQAEWRISNPEKIKEYWRRASKKHYGKNYLSRNLSRRANLYGMSKDELDALYVLCDSKCRICGKPEEDKKKGVLHIDHCHWSGRVRGLLCYRCNIGIGMFNDDKNLMASAIAYLCSDSDGRSHKPGIAS